MNIAQHILDRIENKKGDYLRYNFTQIEDNALKTFFDLAQEFDSIEDFYSLCVAIPKSFFNIDARLYIIDPKLSTLSLIAKSESKGYALYTPPTNEIKPDKSPYYTDKDSLVLTIRGKKPMIDQLPFQVKDDVLGLLEVYPVKDRDVHHELFFEKYANRIGFNIHNRFMAEKSIEHLRFIRSLVADIEHNVIVPNMVYKLFLRRLRGQVMRNKEIEKVFSQYLTKGHEEEVSLENLFKELIDVNRGMTGELENIEKHHQNMSLFIETLFRRSHFDQGRLTLRTKLCNMKKDVVQPQLERFMEQFKENGIFVDDRLSGIPDREVVNVVDVGLIAQVYSNLFSNALKYTEEVVIDTGERKKYIAYGSETIKDFFGPGKDGAKYNVFSTGKHIAQEEREKIFEEEYRGSNALNKIGTGHGLAFVKNVVEIHGGTVGYEATQYGNNFYFILPR